MTAWGGGISSKQVGEHGVVSLCGQPGWGKTETY